jgi:hypothetical protein
VGSPEGDVDARSRAFKRYKVWRLYADPPYWEETVATWAGKYGEERVIEWWTNRRSRWRSPPRLRERDHRRQRCRTTATTAARAARRQRAQAPIEQRDDQNQPLWTIQKDRKDSPFKIDAAMAAILSWEARCHAIMAGLGQKPRARRAPKVYTPHGFIPALPTEGAPHAPTRQ